MIDAVLGSSATADYYVRTMAFGQNNAAAFGAKYKVRAYVLLEDGTYVYSEIKDYSVYGIADYLYQNTLMNTITAHEYLYNNILKVVDSNYSEVDYEWGNIIVKPQTVTK